MTSTKGPLALSVRGGYGMVATRRPKFDSSLERIYESALKNPLTGDAGVRGFSTVLHYVKTSNRSRNICNGPLTPVTSTISVTVVIWRSLPISAPGRPPGWPPQRPLPMWTSGNWLLKHPLHKFFVTDVKRAHYKCQTYR
jgi:hypothetical protein